MTDVSGNEEFRVDTHEEVQNEETFQSTEYPVNTIDYSQYFENLQNVGIILIAVILGCSLCICLVLGLKKHG